MSDLGEGPRGPQPHPVRPFYFGFKKRIAKGRKAGRASDKKSALTTPPPPPAQRLELRGPRPGPFHLFYFGLKKRIAKGRKAGRASDKKKCPHAPLPLSSTSHVDRKEQALSIEGCVTPTPNPSDM